MKYDPIFKPELAASTHPYRNNLSNVCLDKFEGKPVLVATDGHMMAVIPVSEVSSNDEYGLLPKEALTEANKKAKKSKLELVEVECKKDTVVLQDGVAYPRDNNGQFPECWQQVVPVKRPVTISFDINLLNALVKAIGNKKVVSLSIGEKNEAILVSNDTGAIGVLMPVHR